MTYLTQLLSILRAMHWALWTAHWKSEGPPFYGDHQMYSRMYEGLVEEIDGLAEKIVGIYGPDALFDAPQMAESLRFLTQYEPAQDTIPGGRALVMENHLQQAIKTTYDALKASGEITLGLDDFLMALASAHETNIYLLRQRIRTDVHTASLKTAVMSDTEMVGKIFYMSGLAAQFWFVPMAATKSSSMKGILVTRYPDRRVPEKAKQSHMSLVSLHQDWRVIQPIEVPPDVTARFKAVGTTLGNKTAAYGDPYWMTARFPGKDQKGRPFKKGDKVFYYPRTKTILTGEEALAASEEFDQVRMIEDGY